MRAAGGSMQHVDRMIGRAAATLAIVILAGCSSPPVPPASAASDEARIPVAAAPHPPPPRRAEIPGRRGRLRLYGNLATGVGPAGNMSGYQGSMSSGRRQPPIGSPTIG